mmetsp:Transcript_39222/g.96919  ORF Transcript_39222/g.96919 Transcript_39222/m.96919 type:complete len:406 (-) Transcript_39222:36-1253(-)
MAPATRIKLTQAQIDAYSTRVDVQRCFTCADLYCILLMVFCGGLGLPLLLMQTMFVVPPLLLLSLYSCCISAPADHIKRGCSFHLWSLLIIAAAVPSIGVCIAWVWALMFARIFLCFPFALCRCAAVRASWERLAEFGGAPGVIDKEGKARSPIEGLAREYGWMWSLEDIVVAMIGSISRQGSYDMWRSIVMMLWLCPLYKILCSTNAYLFTLEPLFINQWTSPLDTNGNGTVDFADNYESRMHLRNALCRVKLAERNEDLVDSWHFTGHYPYPPKGRKSRTHAGIQFYDGFTITALMTHTAHLTDLDDGSNLEGHKPLSTTANFAIVAVYLQAWNPLHFFTGYVEVNGRLDGGVEHPMWLLSAASTSRLHSSSTQGLNSLFVKLGFRFADYIKLHQPVPVVRTA